MGVSVGEGDPKHREILLFHEAAVKDRDWDKAGEELQHREGHGRGCCHLAQAVEDTREQSA